MSRLEKDTISSIFATVGKVEKEIKKIYKESSLEKPIMNDIVQTKRNMAYEEIKEKLKKYKKQRED